MSDGPDELMVTTEEREALTALIDELDPGEYDWRPEQLAALQSFRERLNWRQVIQREDAA